ncbi:hypothetical protein SBC1_74050 (plasmid) [Caballeronia sp. SBC1]|nr:hypothetical protein SBC2_72220 [Caballeronia sp. SBC2]QIN67358.1 hypothetical protein SBC1_74050 [Caballeronia sp. SBC1]
MHEQRPKRQKKNQSSSVESDVLALLDPALHHTAPSSKCASCPLPARIRRLAVSASAKWRASCYVPAHLLRRNEASLSMTISRNRGGVYLAAHPRAKKFGMTMHSMMKRIYWPAPLPLLRQLGSDLTIFISIICHNVTYKKRNRRSNWWSCPALHQHRRCRKLRCQRTATLRAGHGNSIGWFGCPQLYAAAPIP